MEAPGSSRSSGPHAVPTEYRELMRHRLANGTRGLRWTYSIFWSFIPEQQVLVWGEGYLDGADSTVEMSLRRSQQLRNLYNAMDSSRAGVQPSSSEINTSTTPSAAPEDLTVMEWFYVGSMAVIFASGDGLPGRALAGGGHVWHHITGEGDTRVLVRARLAQRARLQTIVCIPALDGVLEIGTTALVEEDPNLLQQMQSVFLEQPVQHLTMRTPSSTKARESRAMREMRTSTSAFMTWRTAMAAAAAPALQTHPQQMLKAALFTIPRLIEVKREVQVVEFPTPATISSVMAYEEGQNPRGSSGKSKHVMAERRRREELNERFITLRKLVPFVTKPTKVSLLGDAIEYVADLQRQVRELESTAKKRSEKPIKQDVDVTIEKSMAVMKISCAWQDSLLIGILQKIADLRLEVVDAHAEVSDDILNATLKAKVRSSDQGNEENKTTEIQVALLSLIKRKLRGKAVVQ